MAAWAIQQITLATLLALVVYLVSRLGRLGPVARHALWVVVLVKLVTPPLLVMNSPWTLPIPSFETAAPSISRMPLLDRPPARLYVARAATGPELVRVFGPNANGTFRIPVHSVTMTPPSRWSAIPWMPIALALWLAGALVMALIQITRIARLARAVRAGTAPDDEFQRTVNALSQQLQVRPPLVRIVSGISSPLVWAVGARTMLWPADLPPLQNDARRGLVVHELAHLKRCDHWIGWLELTAGCFWWWNPLFWYVRSQIREHAELACDAWVISTVSDGRRAYAEALIAICAGIPVTSTPMSALGVSTGSRRALERRLVMIMRDRVPVRLSRLVGLTIALLTIAALPTWAQRAVTTAEPQVVTTIGQDGVLRTHPILVTTVGQDGVSRTNPTIATTIDQGGLSPTNPIITSPREPREEAFRFDDLQAEARLKLQTEPGWKVRTADGSEHFFSYQPSLENLPEDAKKALNAFTDMRTQAEQELEARISKQREALIAQLQTMQDTYTKAGKLDEAVAVRDQIRFLQREGGGLSPKVRIIKQP